VLLHPGRYGHARPRRHHRLRGHQVGYGSPFALSAAFKRVRGISPQHHRSSGARGVALGDSRRGRRQADRSATYAILLVAAVLGLAWLASRSNCARAIAKRDGRD
jgi:hypothetical protein